jgi:uncharacterized membrane protein
LELDEAVNSMTDDLVALGVLAVVTFTLRAAGFLAADHLPRVGIWRRPIDVAPGNLFVAFGTVGALTGGIPVALGVACAVAAALCWRESELLPLAAGAAAVATAEWVLGL